MECSSLIHLIMFGKIFGLKSLALFYGKKWTVCNLPLYLPIFGAISHKEELLNIRDNILQGSIRDGYLEKQIKKAKHPVIVDCGINVGVTVRWWFHLNPQAMVYGIDMMREAKKFTMRVLPDHLKARYIPITAALASNSGHVLEIRYDDPLFGGNSIGGYDKHHGKRRVQSVTLDDCLAEYSIDTIDLLKVDIENSADAMFQGALQTLPKVKNILLEMHSEEERDNSIRLLHEKGFCIRKMRNRHVWLEKKGVKAA